MLLDGSGFGVLVIKLRYELYLDETLGASVLGAGGPGDGFLSRFSLWMIDRIPHRIRSEVEGERVTFLVVRRVR